MHTTKNLQRREKVKGGGTLVSSHRILHNFVKCLPLFTSFHMMHVKFYKHGNLTAVGNSYKNFPCNLQKLNAANIF